MRPILFSGEMVRAILDGRKTQTRRVIEPQPDGVTGDGTPWMKRTISRVDDTVSPPVIIETDKTRDGEQICKSIHCRYGGPGDGLWVRETYSATRDGVRVNRPEEGDRIWYRADNDRPTWASRITLPITSIRAERVQDITDEDAIAEGIECVRYPVEPKRGVPGLAPTFRHYLNPDFNGGRGVGPRHSYKTLWSSINANRGYGWDRNPWVWVIEWDGGGA